MKKIIIALIIFAPFNLHAAEVLVEAKESARSDVKDKTDQHCVVASRKAKIEAEKKALKKKFSLANCKERESYMVAKGQTLPVIFGIGGYIPSENYCDWQYVLLCSK